MRKYFYFLLVCLLCTLSLFPYEARTQETPGVGTSHPTALIGNLKKVQRNIGCDCKLQTLKESRNDIQNKFLFQAELQGSPAWMNIDGRDMELKLVYASPRTKGITLGSRYHKRFVGKGISVLIKYVVTEVCPEENDACDEEGHSATITVTKGARKQTIKAKGMCGWC